MLLGTPKSFFPRSSARGQVVPSHTNQVVLLAIPEFVDSHKCTEKGAVHKGGVLCPEEMARVLMARDRVQVGDWGVVGVLAGWGETVLERALSGIVFVLVVGQGWLTRRVFLAMI